MKSFIMGVDLGKLSDWTAITVIEEAFVVVPVKTQLDIVAGLQQKLETERLWHLRHIERPVSGTPYNEIIDRIKALVNSPQLIGNVDLVVDATGLGRPVIDMMRSVGLVPVPITITGGAAISQDEDGGYHVPKSELVSALQAWYAMGRLKMSTKLTLTPLLVKEISNFVPKVTKANNVTYEALREGDHDDLVLSAAMAVWWGQFTRPWKKTVRLKEKSEGLYNPYDYLDNRDE